jgi:protein-tyrosine phosphatase
VSEGTYQILMVCTGNICRSPVMERLLAARLKTQLAPADAGRFVVSSGGTWGMAGAPMSEDAAELLAALGGDPAGFSARDLAVPMLESADLILTAAAEHGALILDAAPELADRTYTLREFARLLGGLTSAEVDRLVADGDVTDRMRAIVASALDRREARSPREALSATDYVDDDIPDPYGRDRAAYSRATDQIDAALTVVLALLPSA